MVIQSFLPVLGGAQRQVDLLAPLMRRRGVDVVVVTRRPAGAPKTETRPGLRVIRMPGPEHGAAASIRYTLAGTTTVARLRPDVIHVYDLLSPATIGLLSGPMTAAPVVAKVLSTGPGGDLDRLAQKPLGKTRLKEISRRFSTFICLSEQVRADLAAEGVAKAKLRRIPNGVDLGRFHPPDGPERTTLRRELGIPVGGQVALYSGRFDPVKRVDLLLEAVARSDDTHLLLLGEGPCHADLLRLTAEHGIADRVTFMPRTDDPAPVYRAADLYVSASTTEGMSNSMLEAMASGLPIVTTTASGTGELVRPGTGTVVAGADPGGAIGHELDRIAGDPEWLRQHGAGARRLVEAEFSLETVAELLVSLYEELAATAARARAA